MIAFHRVISAIVVCGLLMITMFVCLWVADTGGLGGVMSDDCYPASTFVVPLIAAIFCGVAFWVGVFPVAHLAKWIGNKRGLNLTAGGLVAALSSLFQLSPSGELPRERMEGSP
jgi:hypothetical protein